MLHILMYHYVRNNEEHLYDCYSRRVSEFECQVRFLSSQFEIVSPGDLERINYYLQREHDSACMLTFDDGYKDHFACADFLNNMGVSALFFPSINAINGQLLDVNAIHYLLGIRRLSVQDLLDNIASEVSRKKLNVQSFDGSPISIGDYIMQDAASRFDDVSTTLVKRLLQRDITDESARRGVIEECLNSLAGVCAEELAESLYLSVGQMQQMRDKGMFFGSHGLTHRWMNRLDMQEQYSEVSKSFAELENLSLINPRQDPKVMCYPYGAYNSDTISILSGEGVSYSLTTEVGAASVDFSDTGIHELRRWDTNDFWDDKWRKPILPF